MIEVINATKYFGSRMAFEKINFTAAPGEVVGILGENGAGKTTLLKAIAKLNTLNAGEILVDGRPVTEETYEKLSFITEEGSFFPHLTVEEHEEFFCMQIGSFNKARFNKLIDYFKISRNKKLGTFSKGQKAKFEVACGFSRGAKYILMDEPFLGNDIFTRRDFLKLMIGSMMEDEIIIIATHFIEEIENFLSKAVILNQGNLMNVVDTEKLREEGRTLFDVMKELLNYKENKVLDIL
ncbi:MAG: ABC transporter ATP-binding protein [Bacillota bacterium]|nr:ABC transporter ATP-binding protein [Bacillota bacterium]